VAHTKKIAARTMERAKRRKEQAKVTSVAPVEGDGE
jgi:hypothetical protein